MARLYPFWEGKGGSAIAFPQPVPTELHQAAPLSIGIEILRVGAARV
jgi:hypothetical protein